MEQPSVASVTAAPGGLRDIQGPLLQQTSPPFLFSGGVLLLIAVLLLVRRRIRTPNRVAAAAPTTAPTDASAAHSLAALIADYRQGSCSGIQTLLRLDTLMRDVLAAATGISAHCLTAPEILAQAASLLNSDDLTLLDEFLDLGDRVKFAGLQVNLERVETALDLSSRLIRALQAGRTP